MTLTALSELLHEADALPIEEGWRLDAACAEHPAELFFLDRGQSSRPAKTICAGCLVVTECLAYALTLRQDDLFGIWGGTTVRDRRRLHLDDDGNIIGPRPKLPTLTPEQIEAAEATAQAASRRRRSREERERKAAVERAETARERERRAEEQREQRRLARAAKPQWTRCRKRTCYGWGRPAICNHSKLR